MQNVKIPFLKCAVYSDVHSDLLIQILKRWYSHDQIYMFFQTSLIISQKSCPVIFHCLVPVCCVGNPWYTSASFIMSQRPTTKTRNIVTSLPTLVARQNERLNEVQEQLRRSSAIVSRFPVAPFIAMLAVFVKCKYYTFLH